MGNAKKLPTHRWVLFSSYYPLPRGSESVPIYGTLRYYRSLERYIRVFVEKDERYKRGLNTYEANEDIRRIN